MKTKKAKLKARTANKKGYRDLVMSTEGISLNIVENATSDKLTKGDLRKAWGRLERRWNPKTREDKLEVYTNSSYKLENKRQRPMDWLTFMEKKQAELMNTGHIMDDETFITHLLNSLPQSEYEGAILVIKDKLRKEPVDLPEIEQVLEDKYQALKHAKGWEEEEDDYTLFASPSNKKMPKKAFKGHCGYCGEFGHKAANCPNKKSNQNNGQKAKIQQKKKQNGKGDSKSKGHLDMSKINVSIVENMGILPMTARKHAIMLILLKKVSKRANWKLFWIWIVLVHAKSVRWFVQGYNMKMRMKTK